MKAPFFWTTSKITLVIFIFSILVLGVIALFIYIGLIEAAGGVMKK
jgi:hypothetical protein